MHAKEIKFGNEAQEKIVRGVNILADAVRTTIGPRGRYVAMGVGPQAPYVTKDGMAVIRHIELRDRFENLGAQAVRDVVRQMKAEVGDGTTTAALLAQAMIREGAKYLVTGINPVGMKNGIEAAIEMAAKDLMRISRPCLTSAHLRQVAVIAANGDAEIGGLVAEAFSLVGADGTVVIEEANTVESHVEVTEGIELRWPTLTARYGSRSAEPITRIENPLIAIIDGPVSGPSDLLPILERAIEAKQPLVLFAHEVDDYVLTMLTMNTERGVLKAYAVKATGDTEERRAALEDLALATGATLISEYDLPRLHGLPACPLGKAKLVRMVANRVAVIGGDSDRGRVAARVRGLHAESLAANGPERRALKMRIGRLAGAVASIRVGAGTEVATKEKVERAQAALLATRAAAEEGIVVGGGVALLRLVSTVAELRRGDEAFDAGLAVVSHALEAPLCQIAENCGEQPRVVLAKVQQEYWNFGLNALTCEYGDLFEMGVVDPTKVLAAALRTAGSISGVLLTTGCLIAAAKDGRQPPLIQ